MTDEFFFEITDDDGNVMEYEMLDTFFCDETGKNYILYTDHTLDENRRKKVYAAVCQPNEEEWQLSPIETDEEWAYIEEYLSKEVSDD